MGAKSAGFRTLATPAANAAAATTPISVPSNCALRSQPYAGAREMRAEATRVPVAVVIGTEEKEQAMYLPVLSPLILRRALFFSHFHGSLGGELSAANLALTRTRSAWAISLAFDSLSHRQ